MQKCGLRKYVDGRADDKNMQCAPQPLMSPQRIQSGLNATTLLVADVVLAHAGAVASDGDALEGGIERGELDAAAVAEGRRRVAERVAVADAVILGEGDDGAAGAPVIAVLALVAVAERLDGALVADGVAVVVVHVDHLVLGVAVFIAIRLEQDVEVPGRNGGGGGQKAGELQDGDHVEASYDAALESERLRVSIGRWAYCEWIGSASL
ncbi:hypothetical protein LTR53_014327 [Teratosphaeriaceae sp. CCFEE 6253]|nr:hypothetical protein LTR53_014327 [Teratosphaeriaceae sp. CCFEE 6253]